MNVELAKHENWKEVVKEYLNRDIFLTKVFEKNK